MVQFIDFLEIKTYANPKKLFFLDVHIEQSYDMLHVDLFNSIYQKSNNEKMTSPKDTDLTLFIDDK